MRDAKTPRLDIPRDTKYIAKMWGLDTDTCRLRLRQLDKDLKGQLLVKVGQRYYVKSLATLRRHWPDFGKRVASEDDMDSVEERLGELTRELRAQATDLREVRRRLRALEEKAA
jgi:hypothetical protein